MVHPSWSKGWSWSPKRITWILERAVTLVGSFLSTCCRRVRTGEAEGWSSESSELSVSSGFLASVGDDGFWGLESSALSSFLQSLNRFLASDETAWQPKEKPSVDLRWSWRREGREKEVQVV